MQITVAIEVPNCSPSEAWNVLSDISNSSKFIEAITELEVLSESDKFQVGLKWKETRVMFGSSATETMEVVEIDHLKSMTIGSVSCGADYKSSFYLLPEGDSCIISFEFGGESLTWTAWLMSKVMGFFMVGYMKKALMKDLEDIKKEIENRKSTSSKK